MSIQNLKTFDRFTEHDEDRKPKNYVHVQIQQIGIGKKVTTVRGLPEKFDATKILKAMKKKSACSGTIVTDSGMGEVIQLQGDQRNGVEEFLTEKAGLDLDPEIVKVHDF